LTPHSFTLELNKTRESVVRVRGRKSFVRPNNLRPAAYLLISTTKSRPFYRRSLGKEIEFLFPHSLGSKHNEMSHFLSFLVRERNRISFYSLERQQRTTNFLPLRTSSRKIIL